MFPETPTTKDRFKRCFRGLCRCTGRVKNAFGLTGLQTAPLPQVKSLRRLPDCSDKPPRRKTGASWIAEFGGFRLPSKQEERHPPPSMRYRIRSSGWSRKRQQLRTLPPKPRNQSSLL